MANWEDAELMAKAVQAVSIMVENGEEIPEDKRYERACTLANDPTLMDTILRNGNRQEPAGVTYPPGTRESPPKITSGGMYHGKTREQVIAEVQQNANEMSRNDLQGLLACWHKSGLPIGPTRVRAFQETRYHLGKASK